MVRNGAAILLTMFCASASGCFATQDESLGQVAADAGAPITPQADAALEMEDLPPALDPPPVITLDAMPPVALEDAATPLPDLDAGHDGGDGDAGHHGAGDAARDAHIECREPWEPWECRG